MLHESGLFRDGGRGGEGGGGRKEGWAVAGIDHGCMYVVRMVLALINHI